MKKWDFDLCYIVGLSNSEWHKTVAAFEDLYDALSYARRLSRENPENGLYAVYHVDGDGMEAIYIPHGQHEGQGNYPGENTPKMDNIPSIDDGSIPAGGGTVVSPYLIANAAQLDWFRDRVNGGETSIHGALTADITYNAEMDVEGWDGKSPNKFTPFTPIAPSANGYQGTFDGHGHAISGLFVENDDSPWCGLFGLVASGGVVKDVTIRNSYFRASHAKAAMVYLGGIAGRNGGTVSGCDVHATVVCASDLSGIVSSYIYCGGVIGYSYGTVTDCISSGTVDVSGTATSYIHCGGIIGFISGTCTVTDCASLCNVGVSGVSRSCIHCGGIVGSNSGTATGCVSSGNVDVSGVAKSCIRCGGVAGYVYGTCMGTVTSCTSSGSVDVSGVATTTIYCGGVAGVIYGTVTGCVGSRSVDVRGTAAHICRGDIAGYVSDAGMVKGCMSSESVDGALPAGEGTVVSPYLISNAAQLDWFSGRVNSGATWICGALTADITYNAGMDVGGWDGKSPNKFTPFTSIAPNSTGYKGIFDGRGHAISGLYVNCGDSQWCGLFGLVASGGVVKDVIVRHSYFRTSHAKDAMVYLGGIAGRNDGTVSGCYVHATVVCASDLSGIVSSYIFCGGIVGYSYGTVTDCASSGSVDVSGTATSYIHCGGIAGFISGTCTATDCTSTCNVDVSGVSKSCIHCGGVAGTVNGRVTDCAFSGNVDVSGTAESGIRCGGVTGYVHGTCMGTITSCASSGGVDVSGTAPEIHCGGVAGVIYGTVEDCVSSGSVNVRGTAARIRCGDIAGYVSDIGIVKGCMSSESVDGE